MPFGHPHSEQRRPARGARCGAGAWSPRPHRPQPGHTGRGTLAARSRGRAAGGGTAPDTGCPSQRWQTSPPGDGPPPPPRHAAPTGHAGHRDSVGPPHPHTRAHSTWVADPNGPPSGRAVGGGTAPDLRHPSQWWKEAPPETPFHHPHSEQTPARKGACCGAGAGSPRSHRPHPEYTGRGTPAARSRGRAAGGGTAPDTRRHSQRWQATPPGTAPHRPRGTQPQRGMQAKGTVLGPHTHTPAPTARGWEAPTARPVGGQSGEGQRLTSETPHNGGRHPPLGTPFGHPHSEQRRPARAHAVGLVLGPHTLTDRTRNTRVAEPWLPAPEDGRPGEGQRLTPDAPHNGGSPPSPVTAPGHPRGTQPPQGMQAKGTVLGPHTHTPAPTARGWWTPTARPVGGQSEEGQRLTSDAPHNGGRHPSRGRPSATPTASNASPQGRTLWSRCWVPTPAPTAPGTHGSRNPGCPLQRTGGRARDSG